MKKKQFDSSNYFWKKEIDYRQHPDAYRIGKGEQGVLICEPYRSEILPYWKFKTPEIAQQSSQKILALFYDYLEKEEFVGADLARKFLQMGFTRSRRYANYKGGRKYKDAEGTTFPKGTGDPQKIESATIFFQAWKEAENDGRYQTLKKSWLQQEEEQVMANLPKKNDSVTWSSPQGEIKGKVVKTLKKDEKVKVGQNKTHQIKASPDDPKVVVKSQKTGKQAFHKPSAIKKGVPSEFGL